MGIDGLLVVTFAPVWKSRLLMMRRIIFICIISLSTFTSFAQNIIELENKAKGGDVHAQYDLGCRYLEGKDVGKDYKKAVKWLKKASKAQLAEAEYELAECYTNGYGVKRDFYLANKLFLSAAEKGFAPALYVVGARLYWDDNRMAGLLNIHTFDFVETKKKGFEYMLKAAKQGYELALDEFYLYGKTRVEAPVWFEELAELGYSKFQVWLGDYYLSTENENHDLEKSMYWYGRAAEQGDVDAQLILGHMYSLKDKNMALYWYEKAAEAGKSLAIADAAYMNYENGDYEKAVYWWKKAENGEPRYKAPYYLGICYYYGRGIDQDYNKAYSYFKKDSLNSDAMAMIGECYYYGRGVGQNYAEAVKCFQKVLQTGNWRNCAARNIAKCYANGYGIEVNHEKAEYYRKIAAENGDEDIIMLEKLKASLDKDFIQH